MCCISYFLKSWKKLQNGDLIRVAMKKMGFSQYRLVGLCGVFHQSSIKSSWIASLEVFLSQRRNYVEKIFCLFSYLFYARKRSLTFIFILCKDNETVDNESGDYVEGWICMQSLFWMILRRPISYCCSLIGAFKCFCHGFCFVLWEEWIRLVEKDKDYNLVFFLNIT